MWEQWVIDLTLDPDQSMFNTRVFCFCPYEAQTKSVVTGMSLITSWPEEGEVIGFFHADGDEAVAQWVEENPEAMKVIEERQGKKNV